MFDPVLTGKVVNGAHDMMLAVAGMHFTGMAATIFVAAGETLFEIQSVQEIRLLAFGIAAITLLILGVAVLASSTQKEFNNLTGSRDELEVLVQKRTEQLQKINERLKQEIEERELFKRKFETLSKLPHENPNPLMRVNQEGIISYANPRALWLLGHWNRKINDRVPAPFQPAIKEVMASKYHLECKINVNGRKFLFDVVYVRGENYVNLYGKDITDLEKAKRALIDERQNLYNMLDNLPVAFHLQAPDYSVPFANKMFRERFGDPEQRKCYDVMHKRSEPCEVCFPFRVFDTGKNESAMWQALDGRHYLTVCTPFSDIDGSPLALEMAIDVTQQKQAEDGLREREETMRSLLMSTGEGIYGIDAEGNCTFCNPAALRILGYADADELLGKNMHEVIHHTRPDGSGYPVKECRIYKAFRTGEGVFVDDEFLWRKDGTGFPAEYRSFPTNLPGKGVGAVVTFSDITERKNAQEALREAHDTLEERVKERTAELEKSNAELEKFAFIASHDLQEPLRKIISFGDLLKGDGFDENDPQYDYLQRMQSAAARMRSLVDDILKLSRVTTQGKSFQPTDLNEVVREVLADLENQISRTSGSVNVESLPTLEADPLQMRQLFQNLLSNGLKYHREGQPPGIRVHASEKGGGNWEITVQDNGIGFEQKYAQRIFHPFERLHGRSAYEGTGMGLALCEKIVKRHNGTIAANSAPDRGTTFTITFPQKQPEKAIPLGSAV